MCQISSDARDGEEADRTDGGRAQDVGGDHQPAAVVTIRQCAADEQENDSGQRPRHPDQAQSRWDVADLVDLPRQRKEEEPVTKQRNGAASDQ